MRPTENREVSGAGKARSAGRSALSYVMGMSTCGNCGWTYDPAKGDPEQGVAPGTRFEDLPENWRCPDCGAAKSVFEYDEE